MNYKKELMSILDDLSVTKDWELIKSPQRFFLFDGAPMSEQEVIYQVCTNMKPKDFDTMVDVYDPDTKTIYIMLNDTYRTNISLEISGIIIIYKDEEGNICRKDM